MRTLRRATTVLVLVVQTLVPVRASGQEGFASTGGTVVHFDPPIATITVTIDLLVPDPNRPGMQETAANIAQQITDYWVDGLAPYATDCLLLNLMVVINPLPESAARKITVGGREVLVTAPGHHVVAWGGNEPNAPWPNTFDPYDPDQTATPGEDYSTPYAHELWAVWSGHLVDAQDYAHEFGHLLGLGDDYRQNGLPLPGRQGTLMDNGDRIDQVLFDRLADVVRGSGTRLPECEVWEGTYAGSVTWDCGPIGERRGSLEGTFTITVESGVATMDVEHTVTGSCAGPNVGSLTTPIEAMGSRTDSGFEMPAFFGVVGSVVITVDGDRGTGQFTGPVPGPATVDVTFYVERTD